jgi:hypothetical protein
MGVCGTVSTVRDGEATGLGAGVTAAAAELPKRTLQNSSKSEE